MKNGRARRQPGGDDRGQPGLPSILAKYHTEFFGGHQFASFNSALFFEFCDCWSAVAASVLDYYGRKKKGYFGLQKAFNPIHMMMDWPDLGGDPAVCTFRRAVSVGQRLRCGVFFPDGRVASAWRR